MMSLPSLVNSQSKPEHHFDQRRFTRREDLSTDTRLMIATIALNAIINGVWGTITHLSHEHGISRTFIYYLVASLREAGLYIFSETVQWCNNSLRVISIQMMLSLRLEGQSSIGAISQIMKRFNCEVSSTGSISQILTRIGRLLPKTIDVGDNVLRFVVFASDEIFSKRLPILVTVDPVSSAILCIELCDSRTADDWKRHFQCLFDDGVYAIYFVSDEGQGLISGHDAVMPDVIRQSDIYHAIAHQLGQWVQRLEAAAYKAIKIEDERERVLNSAKSSSVQDKRLDDCVRASKNANKAIALYETFLYLYQCLCAELDLFGNNGNLRSSQVVVEGIEACLTLLVELNHPQISQAVEKSRRTLPDLLHYFDVAREIVAECKELPINEICLKAFCLAWQWGKKSRKAKSPKQKQIAQQKERFYLDLAENLHDEDGIDVQQEIYSRLDEIVRSSSLVECINSIIRPYLNTCKNHVTQEVLNLLLFYHNHRRYVDGVRKGKTPMEIFTGKEQTKDWISILFERIAEKDSELLAAA